MSKVFWKEVEMNSNRVLGLLLLAVLTLFVVLQISKHQAESSSTEEVSEIEVDYYAGRTPEKRIVAANGECEGVLFTDGTYDGACLPDTANLPTITHDELFPPDRMPLD